MRLKRCPAPGQNELALIAQLLQGRSCGQRLQHAIQVVRIVHQGAVIVVCRHCHCLVADVVGVVAIIDAVWWVEVTFIESDALVAGCCHHRVLAAHAANHAYEIIARWYSVCKDHNTSYLFGHLAWQHTFREETEQTSL